MCDAHGYFVSSQSYLDQDATQTLKLPTKGHDAISCTALTAEADCVAATPAGCVWSSGCTLGAAATAKTRGHDLVCMEAWASADADCDTIPGCVADGGGAANGCKAKDTGYDCNSYLTFSSTNWNVPQTLQVIAVADDDDETPSGTCASSTGVVDYPRPRRRLAPRRR